MMLQPLCWFTIASLLTFLDTTLFTHYGDTIWLVWRQTALGRALLLLVVTVWTASAAVLWLHVYYNLGQLLYERRSARMLNVAPMLVDLREDSDV